MVTSCAFTQGLRRVAIEELGKVEAELKKEAREDAELRERHGAAWNRPSSAALNSTLLEKVAGAPLLHSISFISFNTSLKFKAA